jgi:NAD-dependent deacetylase
MDDSVTAVAAGLVRSARRILAFTGAGISAESGIPTYRDTENSLWTQYDPDKFATIDAFMSNSSLYWRFFQDVRYQAIRRARPNPAHLALAAMERAGRLEAVITQNVDGLHQAAGSREVIELHGNTRIIRCLACQAEYGMDEIFEQLKYELPPACLRCGGRLKPAVVFFGEELPGNTMERAAELAGACDLLIAIGSSLVVYPAAAIPATAKRRGARLIIVNRTPTPYDDLADAVLRESAGEVLPPLARAAEIR